MRLFLYLLHLTLWLVRKHVLLLAISLLFLLELLRSLVLYVHCDLVVILFFPDCTD